MKMEQGKICPSVQSGAFQQLLTRVSCAQWEQGQCM